MSVLISAPGHHSSADPLPAHQVAQWLAGREVAVRLQRERDGDGQAGFRRSLRDADRFSRTGHRYARCHVSLSFGAVESEIEQSERHRALVTPPASLDAWSVYHRGAWHMFQFTPAGYEEAERL